MTLHPAKRLITIDTETLLRLYKIALDLDENSGDRRGFDVLDSILPAWKEGAGIPDPARSQSPIRFLPVWISEGEAHHCLHVLRELAENPDIELPERVVSLFERAVEGESRRTFEQMQAEREIARKLTDPAPADRENRKPVEDGRLLRRVEAFLSSITEWDGPSGDELDGLLADVRAALDQGSSDE